ncbi:epidermal growth factor receptor substrate 15-like 1 isoform X3 [Octopus sinensis]|uniref:Epidermal growth factor receptor substrate 15-like 1 isoform X3 n=1 Tax=Octopus sinensis TaxID=2607531 RepID=A0A7E6FPP1_9MOLL|nr:epidermal growth factor receptor substrate 15-like 1 isoform X3 [Octopus sinensis]
MTSSPHTDPPEANIEGTLNKFIKGPVTYLNPPRHHHQQQQRKIVGPHAGIYEGYYLQADPTNTGSIGALDAARFLKKSSLKENVLSQIWDLSDPTGKGYLEKPGFFIALKLIALAQIGHEISLGRLPSETPPPNLGPVEPVLSPPETIVMSPPHSVGTNWVILPPEKAKYDKLFDSLQPVNGLASGDKVKPVLLNSKLPVDILGHIWDLSDVDKDGFLDKDEFAVAMHLVYSALENNPVPTTLPPKLIPPSKRKRVSLPGGTITDSLPPRTDSPAPLQWVVTNTEKANYDILFKKTDTDMDGFVSGKEIRDVFLQSGLSNNVLAHIWSLCDIKSTGKLNAEQFALAMYLMGEKKKGATLPQQLTPEMVPPTMRSQTNAGPAAFGVMDEDSDPQNQNPATDLSGTEHSNTDFLDGTNSGPYSHVADFSAIKELDTITKDIDDMKKEKLLLEKEKSQRDADIKIKNGEVQALQKDLDAITATLHQLENQKREAQKRLDELDDKRSNLESSVKEMKDKCDDEQRQIDEYKLKISNQEKSVQLTNGAIQEQEDELSNLRSDLNNLRDEETQLEEEVSKKKVYIESLLKNQKDTQLQLSQAKTRIQHLQDQQQGNNSNAQINGEFAYFPTSSSEGDQFSTLATAGSSPISIGAFSHGSSMDDFRDDPFKSKDPFSNTAPDPFQNEDPFKGSDPFNQDPFASDDPFKDAFPVADNEAAVFPKTDSFGSSATDPFQSTFSNTNKKPEAFAAFGDPKPKSNKGDLFGSVPFVKSNSKSPTPPNLPPKQKKQPPPRPAPPRPKSSPAAKKKDELFANFGNDPFTGNDPFASSTGNNPECSLENFADFSPSKNIVD